MRVQAVCVKSELQEMTEEHRELEFKLDHEIQHLPEVIEKKDEMPGRLNMTWTLAETLREDKDKMKYYLQKLQEQLGDFNLDIYWTDRAFSHDLNRLAIFPLWKIKEDLERALDGEDPPLYDEPGPPEREEDEGESYDYDDHDFDYCDEKANEEEERNEVGQRYYMHS